MYGAGRKPSTELMLTILPLRCARMCGSTACAVRRMPKTLASNSAVASATLLAAYRLAALHATEDVENAFSALVKREEQAALLTQGVDSLGRARAASFAAYQRRGQLDRRAAGGREPAARSR